MKTRREVLQVLIVSVRGASMLTGCGGVGSVTASSMTAGSMRFYNQQEATLIARISDLIIPRTDTPGAVDVNIPGFIDGLMAEWANTETKASHRKAIEEIKNMLGRNFLVVTDAKAAQQLSDLDTQAFSGVSGYGGYRNLKGLITRGYFATEEGALQEQRWEAVPGRWDPCVEIQS